MVSIEKWKEHFRHMAQKGHMHEDDIFIVNQSGRDLGRNVYPKYTLYKVRKTIGNTPVAIVSPVAGNLDRARALMEGGGGKRKKKTYKKRRQRLKLSLRKKLPRRRQPIKRKRGKIKKFQRKKEDYCCVAPMWLLSLNPFTEFRIWNNSSSSDVLYRVCLSDCK